MTRLLFLTGIVSATLVLADTAIEYRYLDSIAAPKRWSPSECELSVSTHQVDGHPAVCMHIPVDFHVGEKLHPIGWPRMYLNLENTEQGWQEYDRFEFQLFTESSRTQLPKKPLTFHLYDAQGQKKFVILDQATLGEWRPFRLNLSDLGLSGPVTRLGLNINESDYQDKDLITFHIGGFRLARLTTPRVTELRAIAPALFCDSRVLPLEIVVEGPVEKCKSGIPFQLRCGDRVVLSLAVPTPRGRQTLYLPLQGVALAPGLYTLVANADDADARKEIPLTVTSSPW